MSFRMSGMNAFWRSLQSPPYQKLIPLVLGVVLVVVLSTVGSAQEVCNYHPEVYEGLNPSTLEAELNGTGLIGRIHGAAPDSQLYVLSIREPNDFFSHTEYSLIPESTAETARLQQLARHDLVCVQGSILSNPSPQQHILVSSLQTLDTWTGLDGFPQYEREEGIPDELQEQDSFLGKVHAIGAGGKILVVEYKDAVLPVFIPSRNVAKDLYRGDIIRVSYTLQPRPTSPTHLVLNSETDTPIEVVSSMADWHDETMTLTGHLVKFPQSPQITLDVYAIQVDTEGVNRYFTLVNFQDMQEFQEIQDKLAVIWNEHIESAVRGRNLLVEPTVTIEATGKINVMSPEQANPQILLVSREDVKER